MLLQCQNGNKLTSMEKRAIEYINEHAHSILDLTIVDIAEQAQVSCSTVSRAIRKCGINKMTDIRYKIAEGDYIENRVLGDSYMECSSIVREIDIDAVMKTVEYIRCSKRIHVLARGVSQLIAKEFEFRLRYEGYDARTYQSGILSNLNKIVDANDLVIFFSVKGTDESLLRAVAYAKMKGATVVSCCGNKYSPLASFSDIIVSTDQYVITLNQEKKYTSYSRLHLQLIAQTIIECLS